MCAPPCLRKRGWQSHICSTGFTEADGDILILFLAIDSPISHSLTFQDLAANWGEAIGVKVKEDVMTVNECIRGCRLLISISVCLSLSYTLAG